MQALNIEKMGYWVSINVLYALEKNTVYLTKLWCWAEQRR